MIIVFSFMELRYRGSLEYELYMKTVVEISPITYMLSLKKRESKPKNVLIATENRLMVVARGEKQEK